MASENCGWISGGLESKLVNLTSILKRSNGYLLIEHPSIPPEADHVTIRDGAYVVIPNPDPPPAPTLLSVKGDRNV